MAATTPDGGLAFAGTRKELQKASALGDARWVDVTYPGMTLRDYFAAKAMQGIVGSINDEAGYQRLAGHAAAHGLKVSQWIARDAYKQADAMLAERSK